MSAALITEIVGDGAEAFVRAALKRWLDGEIAKKPPMIDPTRAAYIEEGAADAVGLGLREWEAGKK